MKNLQNNERVLQNCDMRSTDFHKNVEKTHA